MHRHVLLREFPRLSCRNPHLQTQVIADLLYLAQRNKHIMCDLGTGNNNKLSFVLEDKQELIDIIETIYRGAKKGRGLVVSPKDYSTRYRY